MKRERKGNYVWKECNDQQLAYFNEEIVILFELIEPDIKLFYCESILTMEFILQDNKKQITITFEPGYPHFDKTYKNKGYKYSDLRNQLTNHSVKS